MGEPRSYEFVDAGGVRFEVLPNRRYIEVVEHVPRPTRIEVCQENALDLITGVLAASGVDLLPAVLAALAQAFPPVVRPAAAADYNNERDG